MASSPTQAPVSNSRRRASSIANSITSASNSVANFTGDLVLHHDPPLGFFAATAQTTSKAPTFGEIRRGTFHEDGWRASVHGGPIRRQTLEEEDSQLEATERSSAREETTIEIPKSTYQQRTDHDRTPTPAIDQQPWPLSDAAPTKLPWTASTLVALKSFWKWFTTPFGFCLTIYGLNVVAWGGMLFLLLCNASQAMCWAPVHRPHNQKHLGDIASLSLPGPYYHNCNDINSPRRIWIEIDSQILNALFCVTGFGLVPWRFRDLYYLLRWRLTSEKRYGLERKMYALRVLAGIHRGWFRLPGSETLDNVSSKEYVNGLERPQMEQTELEKAATDLPEHDPRIPLPVSKKPGNPPTSLRAPPTAPWKLDFFVWSMVWNTFLQCCLCGFMWGEDRYTRPPWSTGLFVALACIIAGAGGLVAYLEGRKVKRIEGVPPKAEEKNTTGAYQLEQIRTDHTGHESVHLGEKVKSDPI